MLNKTLLLIIKHQYCGKITRENGDSTWVLPAGVKWLGSYLPNLSLYLLALRSRKSNSLYAGYLIPGGQKGRMSGDNEYPTIHLIVLQEAGRGSDNRAAG